MQHKIVLSAVLFLAVAFLDGFCPVRAGDSNRAFSSIDINIKARHNINRNIFHNYWDAGTGYELSAALPFYFGEVEGGLLLMPFSGLKKETPNFWNSYYYLAFGKSLHIAGPLTARATFRAGSYQMHFDDPVINKTQRTESELSAGINFRLSYSFLRNWNLNLDGLYLKIFTFKPVELSFAGIGLSYQIQTPRWLQDFLK